MNETLKLLAAELGLSPGDLDLGASAAERQADAEKAALFGAVDAAAEKAADDRSTADVAAALMEQNAANLARVAREAGVSKRNLPLDPGTSKLEAQKADLFVGEERTEKSITDGDRSPAHRFFFGASGSPDRHAGEGWNDADPNPAATDRRD